MDVTGRTAEDPAASRLVANILNYLSSYSAPAVRKVVYAGSDAGLKHLELMGLKPVAFGAAPLAADQVLVVGPGADQSLAANVAAVRQWVQAGGNVLALGLNQQEANAFLPFSIKTARSEHICTVFNPPALNSLLAGVGPSDVMNRDPRTIDLVSGGADVLGNGVLASASNAKVVFCQLLPWTFDYQKYYNQKRTFRRTSCLVTRVLGNMGADEPTPLLERFSSPAQAADTRYLQGLYLDKPEEMDDPYRYFQW